MPGRVLIVSFYFPPMNGPATQHPTWFHRFLPEYGFETVALTSSAYFGETVGDEPCSLPNVHRLPAGEKAIRRSERLHQLEFLLEGRMGVWEHGFVWSSYALRAAQRLLAREKFTAIVSTSPSFPSHWAAYRIKKRFPHLRWIADFQDPFVGNPGRRTKPAFHGLERWLERKVFSTADYLSANTNTVQAMWRERYPHLSDRIVVTWGGFDPAEPIAPLPLPPRPAPLLSHVGAIYAGRLSNPFLQSLYRLSKQGRLQPPGLTVEFFGSNDLSALERPAELQELLDAGVLQVRNQYLPRSQALRVSQESDYLFVLDVSYPHNTKWQVPSKLFDYVRIGRPIFAITPSGSPTEFILKGSGIPHVVVSTDATPDQMDAAILALLQLPTTPQPASPWFQKTFDARQLAGSIARLLS